MVIDKFHTILGITMLIIGIAIPVGCMIFALYAILVMGAK